MKKVIKKSVHLLIIALAHLLINSSIFAQAPQKMSYQAVIRNSNDSLLISTPVGMRISIVQSSPTGTVVYSETQTATTNANGLVSLQIGMGTVVSGTFASIDWAAGPYYVKTETDLTGGTNYTIISSNELLSVPYALFSANGTPGPQGPQGIQGLPGTNGTNGTNVAAVDSISVNTLQPDSVSYRSVLLKATFSLGNNIGISAMGFCVDNNINPGFSGNYYYSSLGSSNQFSLKLDNLVAGTSYHVRAFVVSMGTQWGQDFSFTTVSPSLPTLLTNQPIANSTTSLFCTATIQDDGGSQIIERGFCYSTSPLPNLSNQYIVSSSLNSDFSGIINNLQSNTTYYIRAFCTNNIGIGYGNELIINSNSIFLPEISTIPFNKLSYTSVTSGGIIQSNILNLLISSKGVCWSLSPNPTVANFILTTVSNTSADFNLNVSNLQPNTDYYLRAYYQSNNNYIYGNEIVFRTLALTIPTVTTLDVSLISSTIANLGGLITDNGGSNIIAKGICWSLSENPSLADSLIIGSGTAMNFFVNLPNLSSETIYFVRAFATNSNGISYGNQVSFMPSALPQLNDILPVVGTKPIVVLGNNYLCGGYLSNIGSGFILSLGICFSYINTNPSVSDSVITVTASLGDFDVLLQNITGCGNTIYYRAFAINSFGTSYGIVLNINTGWPLVSPIIIESLNYPTVLFKSSVNSDCGITQKGFVWSINPNPIINGNNQFTGRFSQEGVGIGIFSSVIPQMIPNVTYHVRAYAQNNIGIIYGKDTTITINNLINGHYIGEQYAGGYVFYLDGTGQHGLIASDYNTGPSWGAGWESFEAIFGGDRLIWGCNGMYVSTQTSLGTGAQNTANIVASCYGEASAAKFCDQYVHNGFGDWYLPSKDELSLIFNNLHINGLGNYITDPWGGFGFWSSSEYDLTRAWYIDMNTGEFGADWKWSSYSKFSRAIRTF